MSFTKRIAFLGGKTIVEIGSLQIGGTIQTAEIERGMKRIEGGFKDIGSKGKSVEADFERLQARGKRLVTIFGALALTGAGALIALSKGAPAVAGAMAKINIAMLKLKMAAGEALKPTFDAAANALNRLAQWVDAHPDLFRGIVTSLLGVAAVATIIKVGGWVYSAFATFFGLFGNIAKWAGWATIGNLFRGLGTTIGNVARAIGTAFSSIITWFSNLASKIGSILAGGAAGSILRAIFGVGGATAGLMIGPLINTYQKELTGQPGFLDKQIQEYNNYQFQEQIKKMARNQSEMDMVYFV